MDDFYSHHGFPQESDPTANWIEIDRNRGPESWWLHEALRDSAIPFAAEAETLPGQHTVYNVVYIPTEYKDAVCEIIEAYNNPENFITDDYPEIAKPLELMACAQCGEEFDAEYGRCPFCFPDSAILEGSLFQGFRTFLGGEIHSPEEDEK